MSLPSNSRQNLFLSVFFVLLAGLGAVVHGDFGISWDEPIQRQYGQVVYDYVFSGDTSLQTDHERYYGPVVEMALLLAEKAVFSDDLGGAFRFRHLLTFFIFCFGVYCFFLLCRKVCGDWRWGMVGAVFLVCSPRIFGHAFFNSKDIPFMALFIAAMVSGLKMIETKSMKHVVLHSLFSGVLVSIRVVGAFVPLTIGLFYFVGLIYERGTNETLRQRMKVVLIAYWKQFGCFLFGISAIVVLLWPTLWQNPVSAFIQALRQMSHFPWGGTVLYMGEYIKSDALPWHYLPVWFFLTTPPVYILFFIGSLVWVGFLVSKGDFFRRPEAFSVVLCIIWLFVPFLIIIGSKAVLYDGWRHVFFLYPPILALAVYGMSRVWASRLLHASVKWGVLGLVGLSSLNTMNQMRLIHPYQHVYFNAFAGHMSAVKARYELDYWGLSYFETLSGLCRLHPDGTLNVYADNFPGIANGVMLSDRDRQRLVFVEAPKQADYFVTNFRWRTTPIPLEPIYSSSVRGVALSSAFRMPK
ncbi:MAG: hypothetical protein ACI9BD_001305 [Candidatus Marinamargulisbacteria bacterium]